MEGSVSFWRRIGASFVDSLIIAIIGTTVGTVFKSFWVHHEFLGVVCGFLFSLVYFSLLNSKLSGGQTPGKKCFNIRTVDGNFKALSLARSSFRASLFQLPTAIFLWNTLYPATNAFMISVWWVAYFALTINVTYWFLFNRRTRQTFHDFIAGSYVVHREAETVPSQTVWRGHFVAPTLVFLFALSLASIEQQKLESEAFQLGQQMNRVLEREQAVLRAAAKVIPRNSISGSKALGDVALVRVQLVVDSQDRFRQSFSRDLSRQLIAEFPSLKSADQIEYELHHGYRLGMLSHWETRSFVFAPSTDRNMEDLVALAKDIR